MLSPATGRNGVAPPGVGPLDVAGVGRPVPLLLGSVWAKGGSDT